jgi:TonB-dependent receptor
MLHYNYNRSFAFPIIVTLLLTFSVLAQNTGKIAGKVTDESNGGYLPGANIVLVGTNYGVSSDRYGNYQINNVPLGNYTLKISYIGYQDFSTSITLTNSKATVEVNAKLSLSAVEMNEVVVSGLLQGQVKALNQQLNANDIKNVLSREEMEKFPDLNTADVLQRVPGINISRSLGEGAFVYIRGSEPRLTGVTVDGQKLASSDDQERIIDLGVINSSQLSSVEVIKALTPDMDADAIGGVVNLVTRSPFDYEKSNLKVDLGGGYAVQDQKPLYRVSAAYTGFSGENKNIGYTISGSYYRNNIRGYSDEMTWDNVKDINGNTLPFVLTDFNLFDYNTKRDHYGLSGVMEFKLNDNNSLHVRAMYNHLNDEQSRNNVRWRLDKGDYLNATTVSKARMAFEFQNRDEIHDIIGGAFGGIHNFDNLKLDYDINYSYALQHKENPGQLKSDWQLNQKPNMLVDVTNADFPQITLTNVTQAYASDPANWEIDTQDYRVTNIKNYVFTATANVKLPYNMFSSPAELKGGVKFNVDRKDRAGIRAKYKWNGANTAYMDAVSNYGTIDKFLQDHYTFAPTIDNTKVRQFFDMYKGQANGLAETLVYDDTDGSGGDYQNREDIYAAYLMTTFNFGDLTVLAGARDEYTNTDYKGNQIFLDNNGDFLSMTPIENKRNYNNVFPYLHLRYRLASKTNLRFAVTRTIARPNYFDLAPYYWLNPDGQSILKGNPGLVPTISTNLDLMFANYFQGIGVFSFGLFYKDMKDVTYTRTYQQVGGIYDGYDIEEPVNGGSAELYGFEVNWQQQFSFLPGFLNGFGIYGNYTYTKSKAKLQYRNWNVLPGQAGDVGNLGLSYEKGNLTARLSLNYSAAVLYQVGVSSDYDRYYDKSTHLDFTGIYKLFANLSLYVDWSNITNEPDREYYGVTTRPRLNNYFGWSMRSGIKLDL